MYININTIGCGSQEDTALWMCGTYDNKRCQKHILRRHLMALRGMRVNSIYFEQTALKVSYYSTKLMYCKLLSQVTYDGFHLNFQEAFDLTPM